MRNVLGFYELKEIRYFFTYLFSRGECFLSVLSSCPVCQVKYKSLPSVHFSRSAISLVLPCEINFTPKHGALRFITQLTILTAFPF